MLDEMRAEIALQRFGPEFMGWLAVFGDTADFTMMWMKLGGDEYAEWATILCLGHAFTAGETRDNLKHILNEFD